MCENIIVTKKCFEIFKKSLAKSKNYSQKICENIWIQNTLSKIPKKKSIRFPKLCLAKSFEIFQKKV